MPRLLNAEIQFVMLGTGEKHYEDMFRYYQSRYPEKVSANITFSDATARKIYAASDLFLMPSHFEPCGLSQLIALKYGSLPLVRETGGLKDTVLSYNEETGKGNGFSFTDFCAEGFWHTVCRALNFYYERRELWDSIRYSAMKCDYSWKRSCEEYAKLYGKICEKH